MPGNHRDRLRKVLALADSNQDGEALAALRKAQTLLAAEGLTLAALAQGSAETATPDPAPAADDWSRQLAIQLVEDLQREVAEHKRQLRDAERRLAAARRETTRAKREGARLKGLAEAAALNKLELEVAHRDEVARLTDHVERLTRRADAIGRVAPGLASIAGGSEVLPRRTHAEIRAAVTAALDDPELSALPDRALARRIGVSHQTVVNYRRRLLQASARLH